MVLTLSLMLALFGCGRKEDTLFSGGTGTAEDPYRISTAEDLRQLSSLTQETESAYGYQKAHFAMTADIDLDNKSFDTIFPYVSFKGVFEGNGHTITGLKINYKKPLVGDATGSHGLFGIGREAVIRNLTISASTLSADVDSGEVGAIMGSAGKCTIENCHVTDSVTITSRYHAGGIAGTADRGTITGCTNGAAVTATGPVSTAGGIAAHSSSLVTDCRNTGAITAESDAGGIAAVQNASITNCENTGAVLAKKNNAAGIAGDFGDGALNSRENDETVAMTGCVNTGSVTSEKGDAAGIAARTSTGSIRGCENTGAVSGGNMAGGIVAVFLKSAFGDAASRFAVEDCVNSGPVETKMQTDLGYVGGICGWINASVAQVQILGCENTGAVNGLHFAGGVLGGFQGIRLEIADCRNTGNVNGFESCGGMVAYAAPTGEELCEVTITGCTNTGDLYAGLTSGFAGILKEVYAGGMVGKTSHLETQQEVQLTIDGCESTGALEGEGDPAHVHTDPLYPPQAFAE